MYSQPSVVLQLNESVIGIKGMFTHPPLSNLQPRTWQVGFYSRPQCRDSCLFRPIACSCAGERVVTTFHDDSLTPQDRQLVWLRQIWILLQTEQQISFSGFFSITHSSSRSSLETNRPLGSLIQVVLWLKIGLR